MIAVVNLVEYRLWALAYPERAEALAQLRTAIVTNGEWAASRMVPGLVVENPLPARLMFFPTLAEAMAEFPDLPWHNLPVWSGEQVEPELLAAREAYVSASQ